MTTRSEHRRDRTTIGLVLLALLGSPCTAWGASDVGTLLKRVSPKTPATHAFIEIRQSRLLRHPSLSAGTLEYRGPGQLIKSVHKPAERRFEVDGNVARLSQGSGAVRSFDLGSLPELQAIFAGISGIMGGDEAAIRKVFSLSVEERGNAWTLRLTPLDAKVSRRIGALEVRGNTSGTQCISVLEAGGVTSTMVLVDDSVAMPTSNPAAWVQAKCTSTQ